jgi:hypothetical protein
MCVVLAGNRNLAGHHTITGDLPAEWYDQTAFPNLYYLKLKGTAIQPNLTSTNLKWTSKLSALSVVELADRQYRFGLSSACCAVISTA